jgi:hypothetical protein
MQKGFENKQLVKGMAMAYAYDRLTHLIHRLCMNEHMESELTRQSHCVFSQL